MTPNQPRPYDLFAVRLSDESFALGQLRPRAEGCSLVLFARRAVAPDALLTPLLIRADAIAAFTLATPALAPEWSIVGNRHVALPNLGLRRPDVNAPAELVAPFFEAYHQLRAWDDDAPAYSRIMLPEAAPSPGERAWLLARLDHYARAPADERQAMRDEVMRTRLYQRYTRLAPPGRDVAPVSFIERVLLTASLCDGYPDPRDDYMAIAYLTPFAQEHGIDLRVYLDRIAELSSERMQLMMRGRLDQTRW